MRGSFRLKDGSKADLDYALSEMITLFENWGYEVTHG